jgi:hypothetical protein
MTKFSYSFSLTPISDAKPMAPARQEFAYSEFLLSLTEDWRQIPTTEDRITFVSEARGAGIVVSADFFDIPEDKAMRFAEKCLEFRLEALERVAPGKVEVIQRSIKPHSGGVGLEVALGAELNGGPLHFYLGYVTSRKVLNFSLDCPPGRMAAAALYNSTVPHFRPRLP